MRQFHLLSVPIFCCVSQPKVEVGADLSGCSDNWLLYSYFTCSLSTFALAVVVECGIARVSTRGTWVEAFRPRFCSRATPITLAFAYFDLIFLFSFLFLVQSLSLCCVKLIFFAFLRVFSEGGSHGEQTYREALRRSELSELLYGTHTQSLRTGAQTVQVGRFALRLLMGCVSACHI